MTHGDIATYLNPCYWDGHTLGVGEMLSVASGESEYALEDSLFAKSALDTYFRNWGVNSRPLHTFEAGDVFEPIDYRPGAVVIFTDESLEGPPVMPDYALEELANLTVPKVPVETVPSFGDSSPYLKLTDGQRTYIGEVRWGVVPRNDRGLYISSIPARGVMAWKDDVAARIPCRETPTPVRMGETTHQSLPLRWQVLYQPEERLHRINIMHLLAEGEPPEQPGAVIIDLFTKRRLSASPSPSGPGPHRTS